LFLLENPVLYAAAAITLATPSEDRILDMGMPGAPSGTVTTMIGITAIAMPAGVTAIAAMPATALTFVTGVVQQMVRIGIMRVVGVMTATATTATTAVLRVAHLSGQHEKSASRTQQRRKTNITLSSHALTASHADRFFLSLMSCL
jgi:hypothetical protein